MNNELYMKWLMELSEQEYNGNIAVTMIRTEEVQE